MTFGCLNVDKIFISEEENELDNDYMDNFEDHESEDSNQHKKIELLPIISQSARFSSIDKIKDLYSVGAALFTMIYGKEPNENIEINKVDSSHSKDKIKFDPKIIVTNEFKEVCNSLFEKNLKKSLGICRIMSLNWFEMNEVQLKNTVQELINIRNRINTRKEYLQKKAALRGNKFINDEGKVIIMNRKFNHDLRQDLLYREYESDSSSDFDDDLCDKDSSFSACKSRMNNPRVEINQSPQSSTFQKNQSIVINEVKRKRNKIGHIMITSKRSPNEKHSNFEKYNNFNCETNSLMKSEGRKSKKY